MLLFGAQAGLAHGLAAHDIRIAFAVPGIVLATFFVDSSVSFARKLIPLMQEQGNEQRGDSAGTWCSGWQTFVRVTLPNINGAALRRDSLQRARR